MRLLFIKQNKLWSAALAAGIFLVVLGLGQLGLAFFNRPVGTGQGPARTGTPAPKEDGKNPASGKAISKEGNKEGRPNEFFIEYRLERDRSRSQQIDLLREIVNNQNSAPETRKEAHRRLLAISQAMDLEMKLENLIRAENIKDTVVFIQDKSATVIVQTPLLTPLDRNRVTEIAVRVTGLPAESIVIISKA